MTSPKNENNDDILGNLENIDKKPTDEIKENNETINNDDLVSMFDLPDSPEEKIIENETIWEINNSNQTQSNESNIFDINITSLKDVLFFLDDKKYDFVTFEPNESNVKIDFRKNNVIIETKYIKYPIYSNILLKSKGATKLNLENTNETQEWNWGINFEEKNFQILTKVVPSNFWEKLFIKAKVVDKPITTKKEVKKMSMWQILSFLVIITIIWLVVGWWFLWFIVLNAKTVDDVRFFAWLWINLNEINAFIAQLVTVIFSILLLSETILLIIFLFKFFLTKKEFKKKKVKFLILSILFMIITFTTATIWMIIDQKIKNLPNWQEMSFWEIQIYDNAKLTSEKFDKVWSLLKDTTNLIWPVEIKFDLTYLAQAEEKKWVTIKNFNWNFWNWDIQETILPHLIKNFDTIWTTDIKLIINWIDSQWKPIEKIVAMPYINISYVVDIEEKKLNSWWKLVTFDATTLEELWKIEWYFMDNLVEPVWKWSEYIIWKPIFEDTIVWMFIKKNNSNTPQNNFDKVFIIKWEDKVSIDWNISFERWLVNDLDIKLRVIDLENDVWAWFIEKYIWTIWEQIYTRNWDIVDPEKSSEITHSFQYYWDQLIKVELINSAWESKIITRTIALPKVLKLSEEVKIYADDELIENTTYNQNLNEYFLNEVWTPTKLTLDGRFVKADSTLYSLQKIEWDYDSDWNIDFIWKSWTYDLNKEWNHTITVKHTFVNRKVEEDTATITEKIFIEAIKKEAIVDFDIIKNSDYVPVIIWFDWSKSQVRDSNISKFIWDYGDWVKEERDAVVPWRRYSEAKDYEIKLTVVTTDWKSYSKVKKLILKPTPQSAKINVSMKKAPTLQWIDFTSNESEWQINSYFWNFGDGTTSTEANPTHTYWKPWIYKVTLRLDFTNKNILEDKIEVEITD